MGAGLLHLYLSFTAQSIPLVSHQKCRCIIALGSRFVEMHRRPGMWNVIKGIHTEPQINIIDPFLYCTQWYLNALQRKKCKVDKQAKIFNRESWWVPEFLNAYLEASARELISENGCSALPENPVLFSRAPKTWSTKKKKNHSSLLKKVGYKLLLLSLSLVCFTGFCFLSFHLLGAGCVNCY